MSEYACGYCKRVEGQYHMLECTVALGQPTMIVRPPCPECGSFSEHHLVECSKAAWRTFEGLASMRDRWERRIREALPQYEPPSGVRKDDHGKPRMDLLMADFQLLMGSLAAFGVSKYEENGWQGLNAQRMYSALERHSKQWELGEDVDEESQIPHMVAVAFNAMCCWWLAEHRPAQDDRPSKGRTDGGL